MNWKLLMQAIGMCTTMAVLIACPFAVGYFGYEHPWAWLLLIPPFAAIVAYVYARLSSNQNPNGDSK